MAIIIESVVKQTSSERICDRKAGLKSDCFCKTSSRSASLQSAVVSPQFQLIGQAIASTAIYLIVSESDGLAETSELLLYCALTAQGH